MNLCEGDSRLYHDFLTESITPNVFDDLLTELEFREMIHRGSPVPRGMCIQTTVQEIDGITIKPMYRHPVDIEPRSGKWTHITNKIRHEVERKLGVTLNHALIQYYRDGESFISEHSDKTIDIVKGTPIINITIGATRTFHLKKKNSKDPKTGQHQHVNVKLKHNSCFVLGWETNKRWRHSIRRDRRENKLKTDDERAFGGQRISFTFRTIGSFVATKNDIRKPFGQGCRTKLLKDIMFDVGTDYSSPEYQQEYDQLMQLFSRENHECLEWDDLYAEGSDVLIKEI